MRASECWQFWAQIIAYHRMMCLTVKADCDRAQKVWWVMSKDLMMMTIGDTLALLCKRCLYFLKIHERAVAKKLCWKALLFQWCLRQKGTFVVVVTKQNNIWQAMVQREGQNSAFHHKYDVWTNEVEAFNAETQPNAAEDKLQQKVIEACCFIYSCRLTPCIVMITKKMNSYYLA